MRARNVLLIIAGVLKSVASALMIFFGLAGLALQGIIRPVYEKTPETLHKFAQEMANASDRYKFLLDYTDSQLLDYLMHLVQVVCAVAFVWGLIVLTIGIFNFLFVKHDEIFLSGKTHRIILGVSSWICSMLAPSTILTTIALCLGMRKNKKNKQKEETTDKDIESFQV